MRYRARVIPLYEGHKQEDKGVWQYREAVSARQAQMFLMRAYPYPQYFVEEPVEDLREGGKEKAKMRVICAWCGKDMGQRDGEGVNGLSHSICDECYEDLHGIPKYYVITDRGKTVFTEGETIASNVLRRENERVIRLGEMPASAKSKGGA